MKSSKKSVGKPFNIWKWLTVIWASYFIVIIVNVFVLFFVTLVFYQNIVGADDYRSIYDWDYPSEARGDFNNDGIEDRITSGGCAIFGPIPERPPLMCEPYYIEGSQTIEQGGTYPYHSYMVKEDGRWFILVLDRNEELKKYSISSDKQITLVTPTGKDHFNESIYYLPVLVADSLIAPLVALSSVITGQGVIAMYLLVLFLFIYKWHKL